jgi:glycosyltransferase involved in cell wall biosynthesis
LKKKIIYLTYYYEPEVVTDRLINKELCEALSENGYSVHVVTNTPSRGAESALRKRYRKRDKLREVNPDGKDIVVHRMRTIPERGNGLLRAMRFLQYTIKAFFISLFIPCDMICFGSTPPLMMGLLGVILGKLKKVPAIMRLNDIFPDIAVNANMLSSKWIINLAKSFESFIYKNARYIITLSTDMKSNLLKKGIPPEKIFIVSNWVDPKSISEVKYQNNSFAHEFDLAPDGFYPMFAGTMGKSQNLEVIIEAADILTEYPEITFLFVGNGSERQRIKSIAEDRCLRNIIFIPNQSSSRISEVYSAGSVGLVPLADEIIESACPSKTYSILGCAKPLVACVGIHSGYASMINSNNIGVAVDAGDSKALADCLLWLYQNREEASKMGRYARSFLELNFSREICTSKYCEIFHLLDA